MSADPALARHLLRLKGMATAPAVAAAGALDPDEAEAALSDLVALGHAQLRPSSPHETYALTPDGRTADDAWLREGSGAQGAEGLAAAYDQRFAPLNQGLKQLCTRWQQLLPDDREGRWQAVDQLERLHARGRPMLEAAAAADQRFGPYSGRLEAALGRLRLGEESYFTSPRVDSYHTIWFEWHQDLLLTLGRTRQEEGSY